MIVVNTCGFIDKAKQESVDTILEMAEFKNSGQCSRLVVTGCLVERYRDEIQTEIPEVDAVLGTTQLESIIDVCEGRIPPSIDNRYYLYDENTPRLLTTPGYTAYIKIAEGLRSPLFLLRHPQDSRSPSQPSHVLHPEGSPISG